MKIIYLLSLLIIAPSNLFGQCPVVANATEMTNLVCQGGTSYRSGVAFNPNFNIYYTVNSGSPNYQIETFDATGTYLATISQGFDYRGLWWNPTLNQLDGNGYSSNGIYVQNLNITNGYPLGTGTTVIPGMNQPALHSCGQFDPVNNEMIYYNAGNIERYNRTTGAYISATPITGLPVTSSNLNTTSIGYTGCTGMEVVVYDYVLRRVYFINLSTGAYVATSQLPATAPTETAQRMSFSNNLFWLFNTSSLTWKSYGVIETCTETSSTIAPTTCNAYTSPSGNYMWTSSGVYSDTIPNFVGCDSIISIDLTINSETYTTITPTTCGVYTSPSGNYMWTSTGMYSDTIPNFVGCDSIISIDLTINTETYSTITPSACDTYVSPSGNYTWTSTGVYTDTIPNFAGCDSILTINLTVNTVDIGTSQTDLILSANATASTYQWLDCNNGYAVLVGETNQTYTVNVNGSYAVELTQNGCVDTSTCIVVENIGLNDFTINETLLVYPNPSNDGIFTIKFPIENIQEVIILDALGRVVKTSTTSDLGIIDGSMLATGSYTLLVRSNQQTFRKQLRVIR